MRRPAWLQCGDPRPDVTAGRPRFPPGGALCWPQQPPDTCHADLVDPETRRVTDDLYAAGRAAFAAGASVMENPLPSSGNYGRAWFAGWLDGLADRLDGGDRATRAYPLLLADDRANFF